MRFFSCVVLALLIAVASTAVAQGQAIKWRGYKSGQMSRIEKEATRVMYSQADFQLYWAELTGEPPSRAPRDINWNDEILIAVNLGNRPSLGYGVTIQSVERTRPNEIRVTYIERTPAGNLSGAAIGSPYDIVRMDRVAGNIIFEKRTGLGNGGGGGGLEVPTWRTYQAEQNGNIQEALKVVIRDEREFSRYWARLTGEPIPPKDVDWSREMLIAVHLGQRRSTGYDILPEDVVLARGGLIVYSIERVPARGQRVRQGSTSPYFILRVPRMDAEVGFQSRTWNGSG
jgi:hypothetical protein